MMKKSTYKKHLSILLKIISILLIISTGLLIIYVVSANLAKKSIINNLRPVINELSDTPGALDVEVKVYAEPKEYNMPWELEFHVFLTVKFSHLAQLGDEKILEILNNGMKLGKTEYSYGWNNLDYAIYTRSVIDSVFENEHPIFVTLTDGDKYYTIKKDNLFDKNDIEMKDAYNVLNPSSIHQVTLIFIKNTVILLFLFIVIVYMKIKKDWEIKVACREAIKNTTLELDDDKLLNKKKKFLFILLSVIFVVVLICLLIINLIIIPTNQYNKALAFKEAGNDNEAYAILSSLGNFKDAKDICNDYDYMDALAYLEDGYPAKAFYILKNIQDYEKARTKLDELLEEYPYFSVLNAKQGDEIVLGNYEQDNNFANGFEDIEWVVLKNENGVLYAVSKYVLDAQVYNTHNGDGSTLKGWLKDDFYNKAFSKISNKFVSKVGLLTEDDISAYRTFIDTKPEWTDYAMEQGPEKHYYAGYSWWLDDEYFHGYGSASVNMAVVIETGSYLGNISSVTSVNGVRPTIIIDYISDDIDYYSIEYADIDNAGVTTRTEKDVHYIGGNNIGKTRCTRCNGTGKVVLHYGNSWNKKEGYRYGEKCGKCGGSGYVD